jgi:alpha-L-fucosidase
VHIPYLEVDTKAKRYVNKSIPQVIELLEDYRVEFFWFDSASWMPPEFNIRVLETVRELAPDTLVNYRIQHFYGDYLGGPDSPVAFAYHDQDWECIQSTLHSWGYNKFDEHNRRHTDYLLRMLATVVSKDGVMMINIGPKGDGTWTDADISSYGEMATWWKHPSPNYCKKPVMKQESSVNGTWAMRMPTSLTIGASARYSSMALEV